MLRGIFFDLDNTLIPTREAERTALAASWAAVFGPCSAADMIGLHKAIREIYEARFGCGTPGYARLAYLSVQELMTELGTELLAHPPAVGTRPLAGAGKSAPEQVARLIGAYAEAEQSALSIPAATIDTLSALRAAGLKLGLITNGPSAMQRRKLAAFALADLFDVIVVDTEIGCPKPDRRIFDHAAAAAGLSPAELLFVGDRLVEDVGGARAAGWRSIWYNPEGESLPPEVEPPDQIIGSLTELRALPELRTLLRT